MSAAAGSEGSGRRGGTAEGRPAAAGGGRARTGGARGLALVSLDGERSRMTAFEIFMILQEVSNIFRDVVRARRGIFFLTCVKKRHTESSGEN